MGFPVWLRVFLERVRFLWIRSGVVENVRVFRCVCGCSGLGEGFLGVGGCVQVTVHVFWKGSGCSGVSEGVLVKVMLFSIGCRCSR